MADINGPVLGAPVDPPEDVWLSALSGALDDPRSPEELGHLIPSDDELSPVPLDDADQEDHHDDDHTDLSGDWSGDPTDQDDTADDPGDSWDDPSSSG